ncbi:MAG: hypothetical protein MJ247_00605 [Alphaproteobacteria bacterium]|nr:hypothetical protein [Alphaproteobacteria bacterium]
MLDTETMYNNKNEALALLNEIKRDGINKLIEYLNNSDYFTAPSSVRNHLNCYGGLCQHSLNVFHTFENLLSQYKIECPRETIIICGLLHDLCKVDLYKPIEKFKKDANNQWVKYDSWDYDDQFPAGHSEKSVFRLMQFIKLTKDEILAINSHMGAFDSRINDPNFSNVFKISPIAVLLHCADFISANILEKTE